MCSAADFCNGICNSANSDVHHDTKSIQRGMLCLTGATWQRPATVGV